MRDALEKWGMGSPDVSALQARLSEYDNLEADLVAAPKSPSYDGMPGSGRISDTTAQTALKMDATRRKLKKEYRQARANIWHQIKTAFDEYNQIDAAIRNLDCKLQQIIKMTYQDKMSNVAIGLKLYLSAGTCRNLETKAVDILREGIA